MGDSRKNILSRRVEKDIVAPFEPEVTINVTKQVQSLIDAHLIYDGRVSGQRYEWVRAGAIVDVDERDVPELLAKRGMKSCCGQEPNRYFQLA